MKALYFGTAGIPASTEPRNTIEGIKQVRKLGLDAMELEFVHSVNIKEEMTRHVKEAAKKERVVLTCHGQYYINLNSKEKEKREASIKRIFNAARIASLCGAWSLCFHAAYYMDKPKGFAYNRVKEALIRIRKALQEQGLEIWLRPEIGGKITQFGGLEELIQISSELEGVLPCIDFAHLHARSAGKYNSYEEFREILEKIEKNLGKEAISNMHMHCEGIEYGLKGEKNHINLRESDMNYSDLLKALKNFKVRGVIISESPSVEKDAILMQKTYKKI